MVYRLAALPPGWVETQVYILEDQIGRLYEFDPILDYLEQLEPNDANLIMQWFELSQTFTWHRREELAQVFTFAKRRRDRLSVGAIALR